MTETEKASLNPLLRALERWPTTQPTAADLAEDTDDILKDLGAAVVTRWNDIPRDTQRHIFEAAAAMEATVNNAESVRHHLAVFLHDNKSHEQKTHTP